MEEYNKAAVRGVGHGGVQQGSGEGGWAMEEYNKAAVRGGGPWRSTTRQR
jgi:hypothetical protein